MTNSPTGGEAYEQLDELYDVWCAEVVEDIDFYVQLAAALARELGRDALDVVELGAGSGRMTAPLARAGHRVTAIDVSPAQLARLRTRVKSEAPNATEYVRIVEGDMRQLDELVTAASADLVLVPFRGMLHVTAERDHVLAAVHRALRPSGVLAFDVFHPSAEQVGATHGRWLHRREQSTSDGGSWSFAERARYLPEAASEPGGMKLEVDVRCRWRGPRRRDRDERTALLELQLVTADRWRDSLAAAGFSIDGAYGWFDARPLTDGDDDSVWVTRRT